MKKSFLYLGIVLLIFSNFSKASNFVDCKTSADQMHAVNVDDSTILNPETIIQGNYEKTIEQVIDENDRIIESEVSKESTLLYSEKSIEEVIAENNQIIESPISKVISFVYLEKSMEEIIAENNLITESKPSVEVEPMYLEKTIEEIIAENNKIIDSKISNETQPLDFEKINGRSFLLKNSNSNVLVGMN
jgi:hypothetical protein